MSNTLKFEQLPQYVPSKTITSLDGATIDTFIFMLPAQLSDSNVNSAITKSTIDITSENINGIPPRHINLSDERLYSLPDKHSILLDDNVNKKK